MAWRRSLLQRALSLRSASLTTPGSDAAAADPVLVSAHTAAAAAAACRLLIASLPVGRALNHTDLFWPPERRHRAAVFLRLCNSACSACLWYNSGAAAAAALIPHQLRSMTILHSRQEQQHKQAL